jgi:predicted DNA-binding protein YlxM (UPF0122 family)
LTTLFIYDNLGVNMKYENITKVARNAALREYFVAHPELSQEEIGEVFGISKQRVGQLIKKGQKPTIFKKGANHDV